MSAPVVALAGYYAPAGSSALTPAPAGYYAPAGSTGPTAASPGYYTPISGMSSAILAPAGYYVPASASAGATPVASGFYSPTAGASAATPAPPGTYAPIAGMQGTIYLGSTNGQSAVNQSELDIVLSNYWPNSPWVTMTNFEVLCDGQRQFFLTNDTGWDFSVLVSSNLSDSNWTYLGVAYPVYQFVDPDTNAGQRFYKLSWP